MRSRAAAGAVVAVLGALTVWWGPAGATDAQAAGACSGGSGVTVVVDFGPLGRGTDVGCVSDGGGRSAASVTQSSGHPITWVTKQPFACRISGLPDAQHEDCANTPEDNAYWGLFWSDGTSGWHYSNQGAASLTVKDGWSVGWRFQDGGAQDNPSAQPHAASAPEPTPKPTRKPSPAPTRRPASRPTTAPSSAPAAPASSAATVPGGSPSRTASAARPSARPSSSPTASRSAGEDPTYEPTDAATGDPADGPTDAAIDTAGGSVGTVTGGDDTQPGNDTGLAAVAGLGGLSVLAGSAAVVAHRRRRS